MAVANGYGKVTTSGSAFMYDTGDTFNSYKGKPSTNLLTTISKYGVNDGTYFKTNSGTETKFVPGIGMREVHYVNILNDYYGGSGNCCPAPMHFGDFTVSPSTTYTYQIIYKTTTGYAHPNYMYHYEYNNSTYVTEYGLWDSSRETDLGGGWKHAWGTFTSNASTNRFITYLFHYEYGVWNKIEVAGVMLTQGSSIIPPKQFLNLSSTRSATQGLLPLVGNSSIDLSNVSFDSNAQMTFDGTDDGIIINTSQFNKNNGDPITVECVIKPQRNAGQYQDLIVNRSNSLYNWMLYQHTNDGSIQLHGSDQYKSTYIPTLNQYVHIVATVDASGNYVLYANGEVKQTVSGWTYAGMSPSQLCIGIFGDARYEPYQGNIDISKIYNRALTPSEVTQNYNKYKTRFNLS
jgi:hypothetical protein